MRGLLRRHGAQIDLAVAGALVLLGEAEVWLGPGAGAHRAVYAVVNAAMALTVAFRRRYPTVAGAIAGLLSLAAGDLWGPPDLSTYALSWGLAMYGLAVWSRPRPFVAAVVAFAVALAASAALGLTTAGFPQVVLTWLVALLLARFLVGDREQRLQHAERERALAAREVLLEERQRIARELHDVIAHEVSMIVVQAGAERRALGTANPDTREVLQTIETVGRSALGEMRRMVGMLRAGDRPEPQPGLRDLEALVTRVRESGLAVEVVTEGERRDLPAGIELCAYRVIQEALTNALKHAANAKVTVRVAYRPDELVLEVDDDGRGSDDGSIAGGHGLVGMRERVALYRGRLTAGQRPSGGFQVLAQLPIP
jgi:signal transduction histidine kinase